MDTRKLLTVGEAAQAMGIGRSMLYQLVMRGDIPSIKIGRARRISVTALDEWIRHQQAEAEADADAWRLRDA